MDSRMLFLGGKMSAKCRIKLIGNSLSVSGSENNFFGYKLDSISSDNGIFVEWHLRNNTLTLTNDKYGMFPIYYTETPNGIDLSSSIADLIKNEDCQNLDDAAIAAFLRIGFFIGDTTPFSSIKFLKPGTKLHFSEEGFDLKNEKITEGDNANFSLDHALNIYGELFHNSISKFREIFSEKVGVPLSGGRDSRHILFEMVASGLKPFSCITLKHQAPKSDEDAEIAKKVAAYLDVKHLILEQDRSFLRMEKEKNILTNFSSLEHSWILPLSRYLFENEYSAIFDGIGGDVLSASSYLTTLKLNLYRKEKYEELANEILGSEGYLPHMLTKSAYNQFNRGLAVNLIIEELKKHVNTQNPVGQFYFWNRTRRHIALSSWRILGRNTYVFAPYLDHELYKFLSSLPAEYLLDRTFHQNSIARRFPEFAHLPYETKTIGFKKGSRISSYIQIAELLLYFFGTFQNKSNCSSLFLFPRLLKGLLSINYFNKVKGMYRIPIYLSQLLEHA